jgi:hypothetical protein
MEKTITFEMSEKEAKNFEKLIDETLNVLRRLEKESPEREARIAQSQSDVQTIKKEIREQLAILAERTNRLEAV